MTLTTTPDSIDRRLRKFCRNLVKEGEPRFVSVLAVDGAKEAECFFNVRNQVEKSGGEIAYGWCIWVWPDVYVDAEHHAVWEQPDGSLVDLTPKPDGETQILFLRDDLLVFDFEQLYRRGNIRFALKKDLMIDEFLDLSQRKSELFEQSRSGREVVVSRQQLETIESRRSQLLYTLCQRYVRPNAVCPRCDSGRKFKVCCGNRQS